MMRPFIFLLVLFVLSCCSASNTFIFEEVASLNAPIVIQPLDISVNGFPGMLVTEPLVTSIYINTGFARYYVLANFSSTSTPVTMSTQSATKIIACNGDDLVSYTIANGAAIASFTVLGPVKKCYALAAADADGDGSVDMVAALKDDRTNAQLTIHALYDGILVPRFTRTLGSTSFIELVDLNGDEKVDLITFDAKHGSVGWFYGHGDYSFGDENHLPLDSDHSDTGLRSIKIVDLNNDNLPEIISFSSNRVDILINRARYFVDSRSPLLLRGNRNAFDVIDWNEDNILDLLVIDSDGYGSVHLGDGAGAFAGAVHESFKLLPNVDILRVMDLNNDGKKDFVMGMRSGNLFAAIRDSSPSSSTSVKKRQLLSTTSTIDPLSAATIGTEVTYTAHVVESAPPNSGVTDGTVTFSFVGSSVGKPIDCGSLGGLSQTVDAQGNAACKVNYTLPGTWSVSVAYGSSATFDVSSSNSIDTVVKFSSASNGSTTTSSIQTVGVVTSYAVSVTPSAGFTSAIVPSGTITFSLLPSSGAPTTCEGNPNGLIVNLDATGSSSCDLKWQTSGNYTVTFTYSGDTSFLSSTGSLSANPKYVSVIVNPVAPSTGKISPKKVTYTVDLVTSPTSSTGLTGKVTFSFSQTRLTYGLPTNCFGYADLTVDPSPNGSASCIVQYTAPDTYILTSVSYAGDTETLSTSNSTSFATVVTFDILMQFASVSNSTLVGSSVTYTVLLSLNPVNPLNDTHPINADAPVTFSFLPSLGAPSSCVGSSDLTVTPTPGSNTVSCTVLFDTVGVYTPSASYTGDANILAGSTTGQSISVDGIQTTTAVVSTTSPQTTQTTAPQFTVLTEGFAILFPYCPNHTEVLYYLIKTSQIAAHSSDRVILISEPLCENAANSSSTQYIVTFAVIDELGYYDGNAAVEIVREINRGVVPPLPDREAVTAVIQTVDAPPPGIQNSATRIAMECFPVVVLFLLNILYL